jgi:hypothetical protein
VERLVEETNRELATYARIKRFALLPAPLTEAAGAGILFSRRVVDRQRVPDNACSSCSSSPS